MALKNIKVDTNGRSREVESIMLRMGYRWNVGTSRRDFEYLFGHACSAYISYSNSYATFADHGYEEYVLVNGKLVPKALVVYMTHHLIDKEHPVQVALDDIPVAEAPRGIKPAGINPKQGAGSVQLPMTLCSPLLAAHIATTARASMGAQTTLALTSRCPRT